MLRLRLPLVVMLFFVTFVCAAQQAMTNDSVIKMVKAGLSDDLIVQSINASPGSYSTTTNDLIALKQAGVSDKVVGAMLVKGNGPAAAAATAAPAVNPALVGIDEVGVYYKDRSGKWVAMVPEVVDYKSGGALKRFATNGIIKEDKNGHINGESAALALTKPADFLFYVPEGTAPAEYLLLKLRPSSGKSREFRSETGGVIHSSTGATRDTIPFTATKLATRMYTISLPADATKGEYGILPPGAITSTNAGSGGKIYTFKVLE
jgi:hypothetical protein